MIKNCKGIILLSVVEAGFIFSGNVGTGVIIANKYDGTWSPPSALGLGGIGWGFMVGAEVKVSDDIIDGGKLVDLKDDESTIHTSNEHSFSRAPIGSRDMRNG